jgi:hypothetical protein
MEKTLKIKTQQQTKVNFNKIFLGLVLAIFGLMLLTLVLDGLGINLFNEQPTTEVDRYAASGGFQLSNPSLEQARAELPYFDPDFVISFDITKQKIVISYNNDPQALENAYLILRQYGFEPEDSIIEINNDEFDIENYLNESKEND